tara:strand:- start:178 stop:702 length:525 start_codon:yes stop_codon:yes gene_type:complete
MKQMTNFIQTGIYTQGCIIPITTEDPSLKAILDDFSEEFRINIYAGSHYISSITMSNHRLMCNDVSALLVEDRHGNHLGNVYSLVQEQMFWDYLRIHGKVSYPEIHKVKIRDYESYNESLEELEIQDVKHLGWLNSGIDVPKGDYARVYKDYSGSSTLMCDLSKRIAYSVDMGD